MDTCNNFCRNNRFRFSQAPCRCTPPMCKKLMSVLYVGIPCTIIRITVAITLKVFRPARWISNSNLFAYLYRNKTPHYTQPYVQSPVLSARRSTGSTRFEPLLWTERNNSIVSYYNTSCVRIYSVLMYTRKYTTYTCVPTRAAARHNYTPDDKTNITNSRTRENNTHITRRL